MKKTTIKQLKIIEIEGGLARMIGRFASEGTLTGSVESDEFLRTNPEAILLGLLYDQRTLAENAFTGPERLYQRLGHLDMKKLSRFDPDKLRDIFAQRPAVHRFTNKMAEYTRKVAGVVVDDYEARAAAIWDDGADAETIKKRIAKLPGFGPGKAAKMKYVLHYFGYRDFSG